MQKISSYLYPNRIQTIADVVADSAYPVEWKIVYQRPIRIYKGVDNVLEFDVKNSDQKRIELVTSPTITNIKLNVMDAANNALPNSPYTVTASTTIKGIAVVTIPKEDVEGLDAQYLKFSLTARKGADDIVLYADTKFGAAGTLELAGGVVPEVRPARHYKDFRSETSWATGSVGYQVFHSSAIPVKFYEAVPTTSVEIQVEVAGFIGVISVEGTDRDITGHESFLHNATPITAQTFTVARNLPVTFTIDVTDYTYLRVSYHKTAGTVDLVTVS